MTIDTLGSKSITVQRTTSGQFKIILAGTGESKVANLRESHHFGRVLAVLSQLQLNNISKTLNAAAVDFAAAVMGNTNYFIKRMYFHSLPEDIARWYATTPAQE